MKKSKLATFDAMQAAMAQNKVIVITHPKKEGRAKIIVKYPRDGAGRLQAWCADFFGPKGCDGVQFSSANGYGYDKLTAALSNFTIDGHTLADHSGMTEQGAKLLKAYRAQYAKGDAPRMANVDHTCKTAGYFFTNWEEGAGWGSCYKLGGTDYLCAIGYNIVTVG